MDIITIINEFNGVNKVFSVIDSRTFKTIACFNTIEEARKRKEKEIQKLYKVNGALGNEVTI